MVKDTKEIELQTIFEIIWIQISSIILGMGITVVIFIKGGTVSFIFFLLGVIYLIKQLVETIKEYKELKNSA